MADAPENPEIRPLGERLAELALLPYPEQLRRRADLIAEQAAAEGRPQPEWMTELQRDADALDADRAERGEGQFAPPPEEMQQIEPDLWLARAVTWLRDRYAEFTDPRRYPYGSQALTYTRCIGSNRHALVSLVARVEELEARVAELEGLEARVAELEAAAQAAPAPAEVAP